MKDKLKKLEEFSKAFGAEDQPYELRHRLMKEENDEYLEAASEGDIVEIADALGDQLYVLCGTINKHGLGHLIDDIFDEIHRSNMSKLDEHGKPIINGEQVTDNDRPLGKVLKSKMYSPPNIEGILNGTYKPRNRYIKFV